MNVSVETGQKNIISKRGFVQYTGNFFVRASRVPIFVKGNESANLFEISFQAPFRGLIVWKGRMIKGEWSGNNVNLRMNLIGDKPEIVYIYNSSTTSYTLFEDFAILNGQGYDASVLYSRLSSIVGSEKVENISLADLLDLWGNAGPRMLLIPNRGYPPTYGEQLKNYVYYGGILVSPYGLCNSTSLTCILGNIERIEDSHRLASIDEMESIDSSTTNSIFFTRADLPWLVYNSTSVNTSRAAIGALRYGDGWIVFVGNESMLKDWSELDNFLDKLIEWGVKYPSYFVKVCPVQKV